MSTRRNDDVYASDRAVFLVDSDGAVLVDSDEALLYDPPLVQVNWRRSNIGVKETPVRDVEGY